MAKNCLFTTLKGVVQGELPKFGELIIPVGESTRQTLLNHPEHLIIEGSTYSIAQDGSYIKIDNKYAWTKIDSHWEDINLELTTDMLKYSPLTNINLRTYGRTLKGSARNLPSTLTSFSWLKGEQISIEDMGHLTSLLNFYSITVSSDNHDYVTGSVEGFVSAQRANGRVSCAGINFGIAGHNLSTSITYQGQELTGASKKVSWTSDGTITVADL